MLLYFSKQAITIIRTSRGLVDSYTILTFIFMGLFFLTYNLYMFLMNAIKLDDDFESWGMTVFLWLLNGLFYMFQNLSLLFNITRWAIVVRSMDPRKERKQQGHKIGWKTIGLVVLFIAAALAFFIFELSFEQPYPEFSLLLFQSLLMNPIFFTSYIVLYLRMTRDQLLWAS
jgi:hypothetical protein